MGMQFGWFIHRTEMFNTLGHEFIYTFISFMYTYVLDNGRTVFQITTQINTTRAHVLHQQVVGRNLLNWSTGKSDYNQTCSEGKHDLPIYPIIVVYRGMRSEKWGMDMSTKSHTTQELVRKDCIRTDGIKYHTTPSLHTSFALHQPLPNSWSDLWIQG